MNDDSALPYLHDDATGEPHVLKQGNLRNNQRANAAIREEERVEQILLLHRQVTQGDRQLLEIGNNTDTGYQTIDLINKQVASAGKDKSHKTIEQDAENEKKVTNRNELIKIKETTANK